MDFVYEFNKQEKKKNMNVDFLLGLEEILQKRYTQAQAKQVNINSYTAKLFSAGKDRILKKIGEEAGEVIIAAKNNPKSKPKPEELIHESADLLFHLLLLLVNEGIPLSDIINELKQRHKSKSTPL